MRRFNIFTDGSCSPNPGRGGYGVVILEEGGGKVVLSGGYRYTTNNRMELLSALEGLKFLESPSIVTLTSDSQYLTHAFTRGWLAAWSRRGFRKGDGWVKNDDLWRELHLYGKFHKVTWKWIRGHAGHRQNEFCDQLARDARLKAREDDPGYHHVSRETHLTTR